MEYFNKSISLKGKQEEIQKRSFTKWINSFLIKYNPPQTILDLFEDLKDGIKLLLLLRLLSRSSLPIEYGDKFGQMKMIHFLSNINTALKFLESKQIKLVNINSSDLVYGKPAIVLGLIWTIILHFQIEQASVALESLEFNADINTNLPPSKKANVKTVLLKWANETINMRYGLNVKDFGRSWRDGIAFNALIHGLRPDLVNMKAVKLQSHYENLENAFEIAERHFDVPRLIEPEDIDIDNPDEKIIMMYVSKIAEKYPRHTSSVNPTILNQNNAAKVDAELLNEWIPSVKERLNSLLNEEDIKTAMDKHLLLDEEIQAKCNLIEEYITHDENNTFITSDIENSIKEIKLLSKLKQSHLLEVEMHLNERKETILNIQTNMLDADKIILESTQPLDSLDNCQEMIARLKTLHKQLIDGNKKLEIFIYNNNLMPNEFKKWLNMQESFSDIIVEQNFLINKVYSSLDSLNEIVSEVDKYKAIFQHIKNKISFINNSYSNSEDDAELVLNKIQNFLLDMGSLSIELNNLEESVVTITTKVINDDFKNQLNEEILSLKLNFEELKQRLEVENQILLEEIEIKSEINFDSLESLNSIMAEMKSVESIWKIKADSLNSRLEKILLDFGALQKVNDPVNSQLDLKLEKLHKLSLELKVISDDVDSLKTTAKNMLKKKKVPTATLR